MVVYIINLIKVRNLVGTGRQGVRIANLVRELIIGIKTVRDRRKPKYAINRTILDKNFHKQLILRMYWQRKAMKHP